jgi:hypothetical protein
VMEVTVPGLHRSLTGGEHRKSGFTPAWAITKNQMVLQEAEPTAS